MSHSKPFMNVESYGTTNPLLAWSSYYWEFVIQVVNINGNASNPFQLAFGYSREWKLSSFFLPLMNIIHVNDIHSLFADNITIVYMHQTSALDTVINNVKMNHCSWIHRGLRNS